MSVLSRSSSVATWWARATAALTGAVLTLVVPVHAWAATNGVADVAVEAAKIRRRRSGFGVFGFGALCCLVVVGAIVLAIVLIMRKRKRR